MTNKCLDVNKKPLFTAAFFMESLHIAVSVEYLTSI